MSYAGAPPPPPGPPGPGGAAARRRLSPGLLAFLIVDVILVIAVAIAAIVILGDDDGDAPLSSPATTTSAPPSSDTPAPTTPEPSAPTTEPDAEATDEGPTDEPTLFASPSGNITCAISAEGARCGIAQLASKPASIDTCDGSVGYVYIVTEAGVEVPCVAKGERPKKAEGGTTVLDYGDEATGFGFTCESAEDGVTCRNDASGRGFQLARAGGQVF